MLTVTSRIVPSKVLKFRYQRRYVEDHGVKFRDTKRNLQRKGVSVSIFTAALFLERKDKGIGRRRKFSCDLTLPIRSSLRSTAPNGIRLLDDTILSLFYSLLCV
ncbi:hypothetical protein CEXT_48891 [Caerostris extrusa]|uniref:Uncharacterized protein n=1 Tax=Caerostris extrusa TaxID=172846 RepID=A0AAV4Y097_CAEEX|nr:hypothetical protein CEXT_48891 [Caerostris extrusa]